MEAKKKKILHRNYEPWQLTEMLPKFAFSLNQVRPIMCIIFIIYALRGSLKSNGARKITIIHPNSVWGIFFSFFGYAQKVGILVYLCCRRKTSHAFLETVINCWQGIAFSRNTCRRYGGVAGYCFATEILELVEEISSNNNLPLRLWWRLQLNGCYNNNKRAFRLYLILHNEMIMVLFNTNRYSIWSN